MKKRIKEQKGIQKCFIKGRMFKDLKPENYNYMIDTKPVQECGAKNEVEEGRSGRKEEARPEVATQ